jgi:hypothetical protein
LPMLNRKQQYFMLDTFVSPSDSLSESHCVRFIFVLGKYIVFLYNPVRVKSFVKSYVFMALKQMQLYKLYILFYTKGILKFSCDGNRA